MDIASVTPLPCPDALYVLLIRKLNCLTAVDIKGIAIYFCVETMHYHFESTDLRFQHCTFV